MVYGISYSHTHVHLYSCTLYLSLSRLLVFSLKVSVNSQSSIHLAHNMFFLTFLLFDVRHLHGKLNIHFPFCHHCHTHIHAPPPPLFSTSIHSHKYIKQYTVKTKHTKFTHHQSFFFLPPHLAQTNTIDILYVLHRHFHYYYYYYYKHLFSFKLCWHIK